MTTLMVTGANADIALSVMRSAVERIHVVAAFGRTQTRAEEIREAVSGLTYVGAMDVRDPQSVDRGFRGAVRAVGEPDIVLHCPARAMLRPLEGTSPAELADVVETSLIGGIYVARAAIPLMRRRGGLLVYLGSSVATVPSGPRLMAPYVAAKAGLAAFALDLNKEVSRFGISVHVITLGACKTKMMRGMLLDAERPGLPEYREDLEFMAETLSDLQEVPEPGDVGRAIAELILDTREVPLESFIPPGIESTLTKLAGLDDATQRRIYGSRTPAEAADAIREALGNTCSE